MESVYVYIIQVIVLQANARVFVRRFTIQQRNVLFICTIVDFVDRNYGSQRSLMELIDSFPARSITLIWMS